MSQRKLRCECGCGNFGYPSQLRELVIEQAKDESMRETVVSRRYRVLKKCHDDFETELGLQHCLRIEVSKWKRRPHGLEHLNVVRTFHHWTRRVNAALSIMKLNHLIHERTRGFEWARSHSIKTAVLFACPTSILQEFLAARFLAAAQRRKIKDAAKHAYETAVDHPVQY